MTKRIREICSHIPKSEAFADVGCDHGYCACFALRSGLARRVYITDISEKCLEKAKTLLKTEIGEGRCIPLVGDGISVLPEPCTTLIAGMGGEEIIKIFSEKIPPVFLLQPMKNTEKVRRFLVERGCRITLDYTFEDGKSYDFIKGENTGGDEYSEREYIYGRDNLKNPTLAFCRSVLRERDKIYGYLQGELSEEERKRLTQKMKERENLLNEITGNL